METTNTSATERVKVAAAWWRKQLEAPKFDNGVVLHGMMAALASGPRPTPEQLDRFEVELAVLLTKETEDYDYCSVGCDYGPDRMLAEAAEKAGINVNGPTTFPWKTMMWIDKEGVRVSAGYGAGIQEIFKQAAAGE